jgi:hypothetical protein
MGKDRDYLQIYLYNVKVHLWVPLHRLTTKNIEDHDIHNFNKFTLKVLLRQKLNLLSFLYLIKNLKILKFVVRVR